MTLPSQHFEKIVVRISRLMALIGLAGLMVFACATVIDVLMRWIFDAPITGVQDSSSAFTSVIIASCFALCIVDRGNITIRFLGKALGWSWGKVLEGFGHLVTLVIFGLMSWQLWRFAEQLAADGETTWVLRWPLAPWWRVAAILVAICVPVQGFVFWQTLRRAIRNRKFPERENSLEKNNETDLEGN